MGDQKGGAYGSRAGDTDFRRTFDREEYAQRAAAREKKEAEESKARYEAKLEGKKYRRRASTPPDARATEARSSRLDVASMVGKSMLVPGGAAVGKRGKGAGFYCESCDLTFKDNIQYLEHLNSRQHLVATGQTGEVSVATLEDVRNRLRWLKRKMDEANRPEVINLDERLELRKEEEDKEREDRRKKRNEKRRKAVDPLDRFEIKIEDDGVIR